MAGSRGFMSDVEPRRDQRKKSWRNDGERESRERERGRRGNPEPLVNSRPAQSRPTAILNPVIRERIEVPERREPLPRTVGVLESWDAERGFGFVIDPATGERFYCNVSALTFRPSDATAGMTLEFTAVTPKGFTTGKRVARYASRSEVTLTEPVETYVVRVLTERKMILLANPKATDRGQNIVAFYHTWPQAIEQQECVAHVVMTPKGLLCVRIEPR